MSFSMKPYELMKTNHLAVAGFLLIMLTGVVSSVKSIPLIEEKGDKDYAYSGLTLNLLFMLVYITSLIYFFLN